MFIYPVVSHASMNKQSQQLLKASKLEFSKKCRRISIKNIPSGVVTQDILELLKPYFYQQIHIDKNSQSCKAVLVDGSSAARCINELNGKRFRGQCLSVSLASCDFMLCITQLPLSYTHGQFISLITPFGTPERCFLVQSEMTGESKGYGCVEFTSKESSIKAKNQLNGYKIENNTLQVHWLDSIPSDYSGLASSCLIVENLPLGFSDNSMLFTIFSHHATPKFCQLAHCATGEFAIVEFQDPDQCEKSWRSLNGYNIGIFSLKVSFCVPGPCGLVVLNALRASRDMKSANPTGGLLPTPVHLLDQNNQNNGFSLVHQNKINKDISAPNDQKATEFKVQQLINTLHNHMVENQIVNQIEKINQSAESLWRPPPPVISNSAPPPHQGVPSWSDTQRPSVTSMTNHVMSLRSRSGSISSSDSVKVEDEVFEPIRRRSQEDQAQHCPGRDDQPRHFHHKFNARPLNFPPCDVNGPPLTAANCIVNSSVQLLREDSQRSDGSDSAYGGSQGSSSDLSYPAHAKEGVRPRTSLHRTTSLLGEAPVSNGGQIPQKFTHPHQTDIPIKQDGDGSSRMCTNTNGRFSPYLIPPAPHKPQECVNARFERTVSLPRGITSAFQVYSNDQYVGHGAARNIPGKPGGAMTGGMDICPTPKSRYRTTPIAGAAHLAADSPTQLQLLGSNLMEGLLGHSPRSTCEMEVEATCAGRRAINALNLFSPIESMVVSRTPTPGLRRGKQHVLPSPEPSPEAGAYVGQHSQGLGGHYADSHLGFNRPPNLPHSPFTVPLHRRRRSNET